MTIQEVIKKIDRYLKKDNVEPLIVDVQNKADLEAIMPTINCPKMSFFVPLMRRFANLMNSCHPQHS